MPFLDMPVEVFDEISNCNEKEAKGEKVMQKLYGTVVPIVTPLTEEDTIDVESLKNLVNHVIDGGLQCLYPCGTTGEMM